MNTTARDDLPDQPQELEKLARHLGFASGADLVSQCREYMRRNRELFGRVCPAGSAGAFSRRRLRRCSRQRRG